MALSIKHPMYCYTQRMVEPPCVVLEASACGIPVIATAVGGIPEQIVDGKTGFLVACEDSRAMAEYAVKLAQAPSIKIWNGEGCSPIYQANFDIDRQVAVYLDWFEQLRYEYSKGFHGVCRYNSFKYAPNCFGRSS